MENCVCTKWNKIYIIIIIGLFFGQSHEVFGQNTKTKIKLSRPEFFWVVAHPLKANRALKISKIAIEITDSLEKDGSLKGRSGGQLDAFKHGVWMALLCSEIGSNAALKLGQAHEKANYLNFKRGRFFSSHKHSVMDSLNNLAGTKIGKKIHNKNDIIKAIIEAIKSGDFYILKKNSKGQYLDCNGNVIDDKPSVWERNECLVRS